MTLGTVKFKLSDRIKLVVVMTTTVEVEKELPFITVNHATFFQRISVAYHSHDDFEDF